MWRIYILTTCYNFLQESKRLLIHLRDKWIRERFGICLPLYNTFIKLLKLDMIDMQNGSSMWDDPKQLVY